MNLDLNDSGNFDLNVVVVFVGYVNLSRVDFKVVGSEGGSNETFCAPPGRGMIVAGVCNTCSL